MWNFSWYADYFCMWKCFRQYVCEIYVSGKICILAPSFVSIRQYFIWNISSSRILHSFSSHLMNLFKSTYNSLCKYHSSYVSTILHLHSVITCETGKHYSIRYYLFTFGCCQFRETLVLLYLNWRNIALGKSSRRDRTDDDDDNVYKSSCPVGI